MSKTEIDRQTKDQAKVKEYHGQEKRSLEGAIQYKDSVITDLTTELDALKKRDLGVELESKTREYKKEKEKQIEDYSRRFQDHSKTSRDENEKLKAEISEFKIEISHQESKIVGFEMKIKNAQTDLINEKTQRMSSEDKLSMLQHQNKKLEYGNYTSESQLNFQDGVKLLVDSMFWKNDQDSSKSRPELMFEMEDYPMPGWDRHMRMRNTNPGDWQTTQKDFYNDGMKQVRESKFCPRVVRFFEELKSAVEQPSLEDLRSVQKKVLARMNTELNTFGQQCSGPGLNSLSLETIHWQQEKLAGTNSRMQHNLDHLDSVDEFVGELKEKKEQEDRHRRNTEGNAAQKKQQKEEEYQAMVEAREILQRIERGECKSMEVRTLDFMQRSCSAKIHPYIPTDPYNYIDRDNMTVFVVDENRLLCMACYQKMGGQEPKQLENQNGPDLIQSQFDKKFGRAYKMIMNPKYYKGFEEPKGSGADSSRLQDRQAFGGGVKRVFWN